MQKRILLLLLSVFFSISVLKPQNTDYFLHTVERGQTVYSLARMYNISVEDVYRLNPDSRTMIREGQKLKIPQESGSYVYHTIQPQETLYGVSKKYNMSGEDIIEVNPGLSASTFQIGKIIRIPVNQVTAPAQAENEAVNSSRTNSLLNRIKATRAISPIRIALILPFDAEKKKDKRMIEYYEGFLLALKDLKSAGLSVDLQVYDCGEGTDKLKTILKNEKLKSTHLIIGGIGDQIRPISRFSVENKIPYVIPFTSESDEPFNNPRVYQINTPQSYLYSKAAYAFGERFRGDKIFIIEGETGAANKTDFTSALQADLQSRNIPSLVISQSDIEGDKIYKILKAGQKNIFVPSDDSRQALERIIAPLKNCSELHPEYDISLFGYSRWQIHAQMAMAGDFFFLNTIFFTGFYTNPSSAKVQQFYKQFYKWFGKMLSNSVPHYGILGYDTGQFFIQAIDRYGASFDDRISDFKYEGVQTCFHFERVNNWSGFVNTGLYFVNYNNDLTVTTRAIE